MIQSIALVSLCLAPQFVFVDSPSSQGSNKSKKIVQTKVKPELVVYAQRGDGAPNSATISLSSIAVPKVKLEFFRIDARAEITTIAFGEGRVPKATGKPVKSLIVSAPSNAKTSRSVLNFRKNVKVSNLPSGYYVLRASGSGTTDSSLVPVTNLNTLTKRGRSKTLVWVTNAATGRIEKAANIEVFDREGRPISVTKTNDQGIAWIPTPEPMSKPRAILISSGRDRSILQHNPPYPTESLGHIQTDRPIYRPGNEVLFKAFFRDRQGTGYKTPVGKSIRFELRDPQDEILQNGTLTTNRFGSVAGKVLIPSDGILGNYSLVVTYGKQSFYQSISCFAYRKPQFKVTTSPAEEVFGGETATMLVKAEYLFAAPLANASISYTVRRETRSSDRRPLEIFEDPGQESFPPSEAFGINEFVASGSAQTDREGIAKISFPTKKDGADSRYTVSLTVTDATNRQMEARGTIEVPAAEVRIGIDSTSQSASLGEKIPLLLTAQSHSGKPVAIEGVLTATRQVWNEKQGRDVTQVLYKSEVRIPISGKLTVDTLASRQGPINFAFQVKDSKGRTSVVETEIEVYGPIPVDEEDPNPVLVASMSKERLSVGEKADVLINTNMRKGPILFTIEGNDLEDARVVQPSLKGIKVPIRASKAMQPGATIVATQSTPNNFLSDQVVVSIPATDEKLSVRIRPKSKTVRPGERTTLAVETVDSKGKPTSAELSLKVIDSSIYQLKAENVLDPFNLLWGPRSNQVETTYASAREVSGGMFQAAQLAGFAFGPQSSEIKVRRNFQDTAFWNAFVTTDASGRTEVEVTVPDNLTTWRTTAVGITTGSQAGMASESIVATQPFTLRIATPRQIVAGDKLNLTASINNRAGVHADMQVSLEVDVDGKKYRHESMVSVPSKGENTFAFPVVVPEELTELGARVVIRGFAKQIGGDDGDAVEEVFPLVPSGVSRRALESGAFEGRVDIEPKLPANRLKGLDDFRITVWTGVMPVVTETTDGDFDRPGWNPPTLSSQIETLARLPKSPKRSQLPAFLSRLSASRSATGWGWWPESPRDAEVSTNVGYSLAVAQRSGVKVPESLKEFTFSVLRSILNETAVPENRALVLSAIALLEPGQTGILLNFAKDLQDVSPFAKARVAEALMVNGKTAEGLKILSELKRFASDSGGKAFLPAGSGIGWTTGTTETTAQYLHSLCIGNMDKPLRTRLVQWLLSKAKEAYGGGEKAALVRGLTSYEASSPSASSLGEVRVDVGGNRLEGSLRPSGAYIASGRYSEKEGKLSIQTSVGGEVFYALESRYFEKKSSETSEGIRVLRRFEVMNEAGQWVELNRAVRVNEPLRVSVVAWSDSLSEPVRITEPIPAGFEYADGDLSTWAYEEIRDGAVVHTLVVGDRPLFFRYYLRAESPGTVQALPAILEVLRRGDAAGQSSGSILKIEVPPTSK